ncbi:hypothetical protein QX776_18195 [Alteromonadaceae bacterium BrNp21-10]|nr:hypothetical protein [Alteromonadaceae bacterium BrNp21-10]
MSDMTETEIKEAYAVVMTKAKIVSVIFGLLLLPKLVLGFTDLDVFLGLTYETALVLTVIATVLYLWFYLAYWKCPSCKEFPGGGWSREQCNKCNVNLK